MHVLKSSGFFLQRQVMRLTAAVTTPCRDRGAAGQGPGRRARWGRLCRGSESRDSGTHRVGVWEGAFRGAQVPQWVFQGSDS